MAIRDWLGLRASDPPGRDGDVVRRIVRELEAMEPDRARYLALFAFLLARVANVDLDVSEDETGAMERLVECAGELPAAQASLVVEIAKVQNRLFGETQNFLAARQFRDLATEDQKRDLIHCLFSVAAADEAVDVPEEETIREISRELLLTNDEYLAIRSAYREKRTVLRKRP
jgi:uncharacterized tellurite resistance protein B-like protein